MNRWRKQLFWSLLIGASLLVGGAGAHTDDADDTGAVMELSAEQQAVVATLEAYALAYAAADLEAIRRLTASDGRFSYFEGASADRSWDDYAHHASMEMPSFSEARYVVSDVRPEVAGDLAFATFAWAMDVVVLSEQFEGGRHPVSMHGIGTAVLVLDGGDWKLRHMQTAQAKAQAPTSH
jgi:hypothetical protein